MRADKGTGLAIRYVVAIAITLIFLFPIYWLAIISFKTPNEIFAFPPVWWPEAIQFANYRVLFKDGDVDAIWNSLVIAGVSTTVAMFFGTMCAYSIARFRTGGNFLGEWIISNRMIPPIAIVFPIFLLYVRLGWVDTYIGLILLLVDGCSRWRVFVKVVLPMARGGIFATAVFTFIFAWNEFIFALVLTRSNVTTFPVQVTHYFGVDSTFWAKISAMSMLGMVPIFIVVAAMQKFIVRGISLGAVKG